MLLQILPLNNVLGVKWLAQGPAGGQWVAEGDQEITTGHSPALQAALSSLRGAGSCTGAQFPELKVFALGHVVSLSYRPGASSLTQTNTQKSHKQVFVSHQKSEVNKVAQKCSQIC